MAYIGTALSDADIEFGKGLWQELRGNPRFPVDGMFWLLEGEWHLVIASKVVSDVGPRDAYLRMDEAVHLVPLESAQLLKIDLIAPDNPLYAAFRNLWAQTPPERVEGRRLTSSQVGGIYIEDVYFYGVL